MLVVGCISDRFGVPYGTPNYTIGENRCMTLSLMHPTVIAIILMYKDLRWSVGYAVSAS